MLRNPFQGAHFLRPLTVDWCPSVVVSLCASASRSADADPERWATYGLSEYCAMTSRRLENTFSAPHVLRSDNVSLFWDHVQSLAYKGRTVYIISPCAEETYTLLGGWKAMEDHVIDYGDIQTFKPDGEIEEKTGKIQERCVFVMSHRTCILTFRIGDGKATWVSLGNYTDATVEEIAQSLSMPFNGYRHSDGRGELFPSSVSNACEVVHSWITGTMSSWVSGKRGPWRATAALLSHSWYRRAHYTHEILQTKDEEVYKAERDSIYSGRSQVFYYGTIGTPDREPGDETVIPSIDTRRHYDTDIVNIDIRSMYPVILRDRLFPTKLLKVYRNPSLDDLRNEINFHGVIANVLVEVEESIYPYRLSKDEHYETVITESGIRSARYNKSERVIYPVGKWTATYAGPELMRMIERGEIVRVNSMQTYLLEPAFKSFASEVIDMRIKARASGDKPKELLAKLLANSFAGKFAAKSGGWKAVTDVIPIEYWGRWIAPHPQTMAATEYRAFAGLVQMREIDSSKPSGNPAIFSYLTSYGRLWVSSIIADCPYRSVFHVDTDGLWLTRYAVENLKSKSRIFGDDAGNLRISYEGKYGRFFGPKHYCIDGQWVLSGIADGFSPEETLRFMDYQQLHFTGSGSTHPADTIQVNARTVDLSNIVAQSPINDSGWALPVRLPIPDCRRERYSDSP